MKSSILLAASGAILAMASVVPKEKRQAVVIVTDVVDVVETDYVTVDGPVVTMTAAPVVAAPPPSPTPAEVIVYTTVIAGGEPAPSSVNTPTVQPAPAATSVPAAAPPVKAATSAAASPSVAATTAATALTGVPSAAVAAHNMHRLNHSAPEMAWNSEIAGYAASTAAKCVFAHDMTEGNGGYGQNIAMWGSTGDPSTLGEAGALAMATHDMWYNGEMPLYNWYGDANPDMANFESFGHFTQLVWSGSDQLGCSAHYCAAGTMFPTMGAWFMVCNYRPAGNVDGGYGANVGKPLGKATVST